MSNRMNMRDTGYFMGDIMKEDPIFVTLNDIQSWE